MYNFLRAAGLPPRLFEEVFVWTTTYVARLHCSVMV